MTIQHCVPVSLLGSDELRALPPNALASNLCYRRLGRPWYRFTDTGFAGARASFRKPLRTMWWTSVGSLEQTYHLPELVSPGGNPRSLELSVSERWADHKDELSSLVMKKLWDHTDRSICVEAFDEGWYRTHAPDTGVLRVCLHMGLLTEHPAATGLSGTAYPVLDPNSSWPSRFTWQPPTGTGQVVWRSGLPVAEIFGDHTILVLPNVLSIPRDRRVALSYLDGVLDDCGLALRKSWPPFDAGARMTRAETSAISVQVRLRRFGESRIVDVPAGATLEEIAVYKLGQPARYATSELATIMGKPVRMSYVPQHGETIEFAWDRYR